MSRQSECRGESWTILGLSDLTVGDVMRARPKTLPASASVADMRESLENQHIVTALLVDDDGRFVGSIDREAIPPTAEGDEPALEYASRDTPTAAATDPAAEALARMESAAARRLIVVEPETGLLQGLVCLTKTGDAFCR